MSEWVIDRYELERTEPADLAHARRFCAELTRSHYENFTVVSWFLPKALRQHFANIYAYCRVSDDLSDEVTDQETSLELLDRWRSWLHDCYDGRTAHPVFVALADTIATFDIPLEPFDDLLDAFVQDRHQRRYETYEQVLDYCRRSANPVGRLVLYVGGYSDPERQQLSDLACTALQLTNFWQDVRRDYDDRDRVYLPQEDLDRFGVTTAQLAEHRSDDNYRELIKHQVERTRKLFVEGRPLFDLLSGHLKRDVILFHAGGWTILDLIEQQNYDTLTSRPEFGAGLKFTVMLRMLLGRPLPWQ